MEHGPSSGFSCPYGKPGDLLWVRESFSRPYNGGEETWYWVDGNPQDGDWWKPQPSIHMHRFRSRLTLELTDVRIERLQDISEEDAVAEGIFFTDYGRRCFHQGQGEISSCPAPEEHHPQKPGWMWQPTTSSTQCLGSARHAYGNLWNAINGSDSWDINPWCWCLSFKVHRCNIDQYLKGHAA